MFVGQEPCADCIQGAQSLFDPRTGKVLRIQVTLSDGSPLMRSLKYKLQSHSGSAVPG